MVRVAFVGYVALSLWITVHDGIAQDAFVYPSQGQSEEQQATDRAECHPWAVQQSGFDPAVRHRHRAAWHP